MQEKQRTAWGRKFLLTLLTLMLLAFAMILTACQQTEPDSQFQPLFTLLDKQGWEYTLESLSVRGESAVSVPIYDESVWYSLRVGSEEWLVYFDSSNRAKYLVEKFCADEALGKTIHVGLRFILCYAGEDEKILQLMDEWQGAYPT